MGFCSSTCNSNDIMTNKKVVAEVKELLGNLVDILNKMDMASGSNQPKESAPSDSPPKASGAEASGASGAEASGAEASGAEASGAEASGAGTRQHSFEDKLKDWSKFQVDKCSNYEINKLLRYTCEKNEYKLLEYITNHRKSTNEFQYLLMQLVAPSRAYAKVLIQNVKNPLLLALDHPDLSMVKHMCMLTKMYGVESCSRLDFQLHGLLLSRRILDAVNNQDLSSLRYFHSWMSDFVSSYGLCKPILIETALTNPNLAIIRYMRDEMGINFYEALDPYIFKVYSSHWGLDRVYANDTGVWTPCHKDNVWELLCVLHELNYTRFYDFVQDLVAAGRVALVLRAFKAGYVTRSQMEQLLLMFPSVFVQCLALPH